jgi:hypothetical protein
VPRSLRCSVRALPCPCPSNMMKLCTVLEFSHQPAFRANDPFSCHAFDEFQGSSNCRLGCTDRGHFSCLPCRWLPVSEWELFDHLSRCRDARMRLLVSHPAWSSVAALVRALVRFHRDRILVWSWCGMRLCASRPYIRLGRRGGRRHGVL